MSESDIHLGDIDVRAAAAYLRLHGWVLGRQGELGDRWRMELDDAARNVAIPHADLDESDREVMLASALRVLGEVEQRPWQAIARDLTYADSDLVRFRLVAPDLARGEIPALAAPELVKGAVETLTYAARAEVQPRPFYAGGMLPSSVRSFLGDASVQGTTRGSVVLNIRSALPLPQYSIVPESEQPISTVPFGRRAVRRLLASVRAAKTATHRDVATSLAVDAYDEDIEEGLSANLCDALTQLAGHASKLDARIELNVRWSLAAPSDEPETSVEIGRGELEQLPNLADSLRSILPLEDRLVTGYVKQLQRPPGEPDGAIQMIVDLDGKAATVRVLLEAKDYHEALRAHDDNLELEVRGTLEKAGRIWELAAPTSVRVCPPKQAGK